MSLVQQASAARLHVPLRVLARPGRAPVCPLSSPSEHRDQRRHPGHALLRLHRRRDRPQVGQQVGPPGVACGQRQEQQQQQQGSLLARAGCGTPRFPAPRSGRGSLSRSLPSFRPVHILCASTAMFNQIPPHTPLPSRTHTTTHTHTATSHPSPCCRLTMTIMLVGCCLLTGAYGPTPQVFLSVFCFSLFFYSTGVGGEYPLASRCARQPAHPSSCCLIFNPAGCPCQRQGLPCKPAGSRHAQRGGGRWWRWMERPLVSVFSLSTFFCHLLCPRLPFRLARPCPAQLCCRARRGRPGAAPPPWRDGGAHIQPAGLG